MNNNNLFINKISINNFRCFNDLSVSLNVPNGEEGSGLNLLVGENGLGKTSFLQAIEFTFNSYTAENRLKLSDFADIDQAIKVECLSNKFYVAPISDFQNSNYIIARGVSFTAQIRNTKKRNSVFSPLIDAKTYFEFDESIYYSKKTQEVYTSGNNNQTKPIDSRDKIYETSRILNEQFKPSKDFLSVFFFDKSSSRHLYSGTFKTSFDRIKEDRAWRFLKETKKNSEELGHYFRSLDEEAQRFVSAKTGSGDAMLAKKFSDFFEDQKYSKLGIEYFNLMQPFENAFFAMRSDDNYTQIPPRNLGAGVEYILSILFQKMLAEGANGKKVYLFDEPELHLHPKAQKKICEMLLEESKTSQIIISTHSPFILQQLLPKSNALEFSRNDNGSILVEKRSPEAKKLFPWSPSVGEITYRTLNLATREFHDELYGYLQSLLSEQQYPNGDRFCTIKDTEKFLVESCASCSASKIWKNAKSGKCEKLTIPSFIRNFIHHPENNSNDEFTDEELEESTSKLIKAIDSFQTS